jgi:hypothetical protein
MTAHEPSPSSPFSNLNLHDLNRRSAEILEAGHLPWSPASELASVALIRHALETSAVEIRAIEEPDLLLAKLQAHPQETMHLLTQTDLGEPFEIDLDSNPIQAATQLLEEILASLRALSPRPSP